MNQIEIWNETEETITELETVKELMEYACSYEKLENVVFNLIMVDNETIHKINKEYRKIDRPTDVISFALEDGLPFVSMEGCPRVLGDIYISIEKANEQALEYGHSLKRELCFLALHGLLHLLGYNHEEKEEEKIMFEKQNQILDSFGIKR